MSIKDQSGKKVVQFDKIRHLVVCKPFKTKHNPVYIFSYKLIFLI